MVHTVPMRRLGTFGAAVIACALLGCGSSSHPTALTKAPCPPGKTLIEGHFRYQACAPLATARVAFVCAETGYELEVIMSEVLRPPQPQAIQNELEHAAAESAVTLKHALKALTATGEPAPNELTEVDRHRRELLEYLNEVRTKYRGSQSLGRWFKSLVARDRGCGAKA